MKSYPSIDGRYIKGVILTAFDKLDGSNIRAEWSRKRGFYKFGTRTRLVDESDDIFGHVPEMILVKYGDDLDSIFRAQRYDRAVAFFEYWCPDSFAGTHPEDASGADVTLIDVAPYKKGLLVPRDFLSIFGGLKIPNIVHTGALDSDFVTAVKNGTLEGMTFEVVVCTYPNPKNGNIGMFKIKSNLWLDKLREHVDGDDNAFRRLA